MFARWTPTFYRWSQYRPRWFQHRLGDQPIFRNHGSTWRVSTLIWPDTTESVQSSLLRILNVAHREQLSAAALVTQLAAEHRGVHRRRLNRLAQRMNNHSLIDALEQTPDSLSQSDILALRLASHNGTLRETYQVICNEDHSRAREMRLRFQKSLWYFTAVTIISIFIITFMNLTVGQEIPGILNNLSKSPDNPPAAQTISHTSWNLHYATYAIYSGGVFLILCTFFCFTPFGRLLRNRISSRGLSTIFNMRTSHLLRMLSIAEGAGRPLPGSLSTLARYHFDRNFRQRLLYARNEVEQGVPLWESLSNTKLLSQDEAKALQNSAAYQTEPWLLRQLAQQRKNQTLHRLSVGLAFFHPLMVILFGIVVLWVSFQLFAFLRNIVLYM